MMFYVKNIKRRQGFCGWRGLICACTAAALTVLTVVPSGRAESVESLHLPPIGTMVRTSRPYEPLLLRGLLVRTESPLHLEFILSNGQAGPESGPLARDVNRLIAYFMAALTVPQEDLWVNLSPVEGDRIVPPALARTELGRDLLAQDYLLKQLTASLMYPEDDLGRDFWKAVRERSGGDDDAATMALHTFNKVWIIPEEAAVYENDGAVYVTHTKLKVLLDIDYQAMKAGALDPGTAPSGDIRAEAVREVLLPAVEYEVNHGEHFAPLRQIYHALVLAKWYKEMMRETILSQVYVDRNKVAGIDSVDESLKQEIYDRYVKAYDRGVFSYIREDYDRLGQRVIPRKYFSGGFQDRAILLERSLINQVAEAFRGERFKVRVDIQPQGPDGSDITDLLMQEVDMAQTAEEEARRKLAALPTQTADDRLQTWRELEQLGRAVPVNLVREYIFRADYDLSDLEKAVALYVNLHGSDARYMQEVLSVLGEQATDKTLFREALEIRRAGFEVVLKHYPAEGSNQKVRVDPHDDNPQADYADGSYRDGEQPYEEVRWVETKPERYEVQRGRWIFRKDRAMLGAAGVQNVPSWDWSDLTLLGAVRDDVLTVSGGRLFTAAADLGFIDQWSELILAYPEESIAVAAVVTGALAVGHHYLTRHSLRFNRFLLRNGYGDSVRIARRLGGLGPEAARDLLELLIGRDDQVEAAKDALIRVGKPGVPQLLFKFFDNPPSMRDDIAEVLGQIGDRRAVPVLIRELGRRVSAPVIAALGRLGDRRAVEVLMSVFRGPYREEYQKELLTALRAVTEAGEESATRHDPGRRIVNWILENPYISSSVLDARILRLYRNPPATVDLEDRNRLVSATLKDMGKNGGQANPDQAAVYVNDASPIVRRAASEALLLLEDIRSIEPVIAAMATGYLSGEGLQRRIGQLRKAGATDQAINLAYMSALNTTREVDDSSSVQATLYSIQRHAKLSFGQQREIPIAGGLIPVIRYLARPGNTSAVKPLVNKLRDSDTVKLEILRAFTVIGDPSAVAAVEPLLGDSRREIRRAARDYLFALQLSGIEKVRYHVQLLAQEEIDSGDDAYFKEAKREQKTDVDASFAAIRDVIRTQPSPSAVEELLVLFGSPIPQVRDFAREVLTEIGATAEQFQRGYLGALSSKERGVRAAALNELELVAEYSAADNLLEHILDRDIDLSELHQVKALYTKLNGVYAPHLAVILESLGAQADQRKFRRQAWQWLQEGYWTVLEEETVFEGTREEWVDVEIPETADGRDAQGLYSGYRQVPYKEVEYKIRRGGRIRDDFAMFAQLPNAADDDPVGGIDMQDIRVDRQGPGNGPELKLGRTPLDPGITDQINGFAPRITDIERLSGDQPLPGLPADPQV